MPDLNKVELLELHQNFWWDRLQKRVACRDNQWPATLVVVKYGHFDLILVMPRSRDNPAIDSSGVVTLLHFDLHLVITVVGTKRHVFSLLVPAVIIMCHKGEAG
ncbi:hypothetical protein L2E82_04845 [Cichorium intybus]|uniref:Uncharacterized protein n=1 Tax=Cichorium intybus TaxID=13427 RepID=A0ACB9H781_CICIN|nr:hypothetical protein L2E82_04845 [Cichorium intybus]